MSVAKAVAYAAPHVINQPLLGTERVFRGLQEAFGVVRPESVGSPYVGDLAGKLVSQYGGNGLRS